MSAPSKDIAEMLVADSSLGLEIGVDLFIGREPSKPEDSVTIYDLPGRAPQLTMDEQGYEYPSVQVRVRNRDYITGWELINNIKNILHGMSQTTWDGKYYAVISCMTGPGLLDWDEKSRARFITNFNIERR